jgi:hypothetical protein
MDTDWPDWPFSEKTAGDLARYVDDNRTRSLVPSDCLSAWGVGSAEGRRRAERLYNALLDRRIVYSNEPWNPAAIGPSGLIHQRVRGPAETVQGPATCLDLALVFAGMAIAADVRPLIGLRTRPLPHALVILDIGVPLSSWVGGRSGAGVPGFAERPDEAGVYDLQPATAGLPAASSPGADDRWQVIDVFRSARRRKRIPDEYGLEAVGAAVGDVTTPPDRWLRQILERAQDWIVVDVDRVRQVRPGYAPPAGRSVPAIHGYLPALPAFTEYPTRKEALNELREIADYTHPPEVVVLHGESGLGKSMLAHRLAVSADHGCGWFLNASDDKMLTRSLAEAERQELALRSEAANAGASTEKPDLGEDRALAASALDRLREADPPWVVVLDNCDSPPTTTSLQELIPRPARTGQIVIITTKNDKWRNYAENRGWHWKSLLPLSRPDLSELGLPEWMDDAVGGRPLIAQPLAALTPIAGAGMRERLNSDGTRMVWDLIRALDDGGAEATAVARVLAWCPPEPMSVAALLATAGDKATAAAVEALAGLRFVTEFFPDSGRAIQMHRLFAATVRDQTWAEAPESAAEAIAALLTCDQGRRFFIDAADSTALGRLERGAEPEEKGDAGRATGHLAGQSGAGLLWYGLGHVRERRGPVSESERFFIQAREFLLPELYPVEIAESMVGSARMVFQTKKTDLDLLTEARITAEQARDLVDGLPGLAARLMREQAEALSLLISQDIAVLERNAKRRAPLLDEVREKLWQSYERRLRIARENRSGCEAPSRGSPPTAQDGLESERAYYNLAGVNIQLAKTHHSISASDCDRISAHLSEAIGVYDHVRMLRERRYAGRAHPHLASCIHGKAIAAYYSAVLLGETGQLSDAFGLAGLALEQRRKIAGSLTGTGSSTVLRDSDVRKSVDFLLKLSVAGVLGRSDRALDGVAAALSSFREAVSEWSQPG